MARVQLEAGELDHNYRVHQAIAKILQQGEPALISMNSIEMYEVEDEEGTVIETADIPTRLNQIVEVLDEESHIDAEYEVVGDDVRFRRKPR
jgi:hypothetical protein